MGNYTGGEATRELVDVKRHSHKDQPGVMFRWSNNSGSIHVGHPLNYFKTADAFIQTEGDSAGDTELIMPLVFPNISGSYYANDDQIQSVNRNGYADSVTYGFNIPWVWFEKNYPDIIGWVQDGLGTFIDDNNATLSKDTSQNRPGLKVIGVYQITNRPSLTIPGFMVRVDQVEEPQWGHKFP